MKPIQTVGYIYEHYLILNDLLYSFLLVYVFSSFEYFLMICYNFI
jgi:hypothetical protein